MSLMMHVVARVFAFAFYDCPRERSAHSTPSPRQVSASARASLEWWLFVVSRDVVPTVVIRGGVTKDVIVVGVIDASDVVHMFVCTSRSTS